MSEEKLENANENVEEVQDDNGVKISDDVVAVIAGMAASNVPGVAEMAGGFASGVSEVFSGKKNMAKGIKVEINGQEVKIDVNIIVEYGARIPDVAFEIQKNVKKNVESMTGLNATDVNVHVQGVVTMQKKEETEAQAEKAHEAEPKKGRGRRKANKDAEPKAEEIKKEVELAAEEIEANAEEVEESEESEEDV